MTVTVRSPKTGSLLENVLLNVLTSTGAYAAGDAIDAITSLKLKYAVRLESVVVRSNVTPTVTPSFYIVFFKSAPQATVFTDNAAGTIAAVDADRVIGVVRVASGDFALPVAAGPIYAALGGINQTMTPADLGEIYVGLIADNAYDAIGTAELSIELNFTRV